MVRGGGDGVEPCFCMRSYLLNVLDDVLLSKCGAS